MVEARLYGKRRGVQTPGVKRCHLCIPKSASLIQNLWVRLDQRRGSMSGYAAGSENALLSMHRSGAGRTYSIVSHKIEASTKILGTFNILHQNNCVFLPSQVLPHMRQVKAWRQNNFPMHWACMIAARIHTARPRIRMPAAWRTAEHHGG